MLPGMIILMFCASGWAYGQSLSAAPPFEVATVKPSAPIGAGRVPPRAMFGGPGTPDPSRLSIQSFSLSNLVQMAYQLHPYQLSGPGWLETERFDIAAKVPDEATKEQLPLMMQSLLAGRFHLMLHHEKKEGPVYDLVVGGDGPKLQESMERHEPAKNQTSSPPLGQPKFDGEGFPVLPEGRTTMIFNGRATRRFSETRVGMFAIVLSGLLGRPVTDQTGLRGKYDFTLRWVMEGAGQPGDDAGPDLFTAIQEQLGLKLEHKKGLIDMIVIDHIDRVPTEN